MNRRHTALYRLSRRRRKGGVWTTLANRAQPTDKRIEVVVCFSVASYHQILQQVYLTAEAKINNKNLYSFAEIQIE